VSYASVNFSLRNVGAGFVIYWWITAGCVCKAKGRWRALFLRENSGGFPLGRNFGALLARLRQSDSNGLLAILDLVLARFHVTHFRAYRAAGLLAVLAAPPASA
jgi:hypothetical protein